MTTTPEPAPEPREAGRRRGGRSRLHRRIAGALAIGLGLLTTAGLYTAATADVNEAHAQAADAALLQRGQELYNATPASAATARTCRASRTAARA